MSQRCYRASDNPTDIPSFNFSRDIILRQHLSYTDTLDASENGTITVSIASIRTALDNDRVISSLSNLLYASRLERDADYAEARGEPSVTYEVR